MKFRKVLPDDYIYWALLARKDRFKIDDEKLLRLPSDEAAALSRKCTSNWHSSRHVTLNGPLQQATEEQFCGAIVAIEARMWREMQVGVKNGLQVILMHVCGTNAALNHSAETTYNPCKSSRANARAWYNRVTDCYCEDGELGSDGAGQNT